jgi:hypothetical protein
MASRLVLNGFTMNPITHLPFLTDVLRGLAEYDKNHQCDTGIDGPIHTNYLGKTIFGPNGVTVTDKDNNGNIVQGVLENGYYTLRIWDNVYPAKIQFDLFLENDLLDIDLIIDHFSAPGIPQDGFGLFDYTYSITKFKEHTSPLQKYNIYKNSQYEINDKIIVDDSSRWIMKLNQLETSQCYFCKENATHWILYNKEIDGMHTNYTSVNTCLYHRPEGKTTEDPYSTQPNQLYSYKNQPTFARKEIKNKDGEVLFTVNIPEE